ncbi:MAG: hypothetical protein ACK4ON_11410 [Bacteroidia bacterium]
MWKRIYVKGGGSVTIENAIIADALVGIYAENGASESVYQVVRYSYIHKARIIIGFLVTIVIWILVITIQLVKHLISQLMNLVQV